MKIIVDAMGGDHAPLEIVKGALRAMWSCCLWAGKRRSGRS